jgi:hypothetical protein
MLLNAASQEGVPKDVLSSAHNVCADIGAMFQAQDFLKVYSARMKSGRDDSESLLGLKACLSK